MSDTSTAVAPAPEAGQPAGPSWWQRLLSWFREANSVVLTAYAFMLALAVGAVLIVVTDKDTLKASKYFFQAPGDTLSAAWSAVSSAYSALFEGAILDPATLCHLGEQSAVGQRGLAALAV